MVGGVQCMVYLVANTVLYCREGVHDDSVHILILFRVGVCLKGK